MTKHSDRPQTGELSQAEIAEQLAPVLRSDYPKYLEPLRLAVVGRIVMASTAGRAGFLLSFADDSWVAAFLLEDRMRFELGKGVVSAAVSAMLNSEDVGDGYEPLSYCHPYSDEFCDIGAEVANCHGQAITGLGYGSNCIIFCFPNGMTLQSSLVIDSSERLALRVFWEQW